MARVAERLRQAEARMDAERGDADGPRKVYVGVSPKQWDLEDPDALWALPVEQRQSPGCGYVAFIGEAECEQWLRAQD